MSEPPSRRRTLLDGRYRWGTATQQTGRYGAESIHLLIYHPDTTNVMRRVNRSTRLWPLAGTVLTLLAGLIVPALVDVAQPVAFITTGIFALAVWAVLTWISLPVRSRAVSFLATTSALTPQEAHQERYEHAAAVYLRLDYADRLYDRGATQWEEYRSEWARAYETLRAY